MRIQYEILLQFFFWGLETFSRRDCGLILAGYRQTASERELDRLLARLQHQRLIERRGRGHSAKFTITAAGKQRVRSRDPSSEWDRGWDGKWRAFTFDLPVSRRKDRMVLWRALREHKLGLLQHSVWVWPHEVEPFLQAVIHAHGIPECFCGFEAGRLFLCNDTEVVAASWDFVEIARRQDAYLRHGVANTRSLERARDLRELGRVARVERNAFEYAFSLDPLLPRPLWPASYKGEEVTARRQTFRSCLRRRLRELSR